MDNKEKAQEAKAIGNEAFKAKNFEEAIKHFTVAIEHDPTDHIFFSNRSACYASLKEYEKALTDGTECVRLKPDWAKGYARRGLAEFYLQRYEEALATYEKGLALSPEDENMKTMFGSANTKLFVGKLLGPWHGTVSEELGGYDQEMEFKDDVVIVKMLGKDVEARYWVDCKHDPVHMNVQVPMQDPAMGFPPTVPYISRIDDEGLHVCVPLKNLTRPTAFEGPGYVLMHRGPQPLPDFSEDQHLTEEQRLTLCLSELIRILPDTKLKAVSPTDSEEEANKIVIEHLRIEKCMHQIQLRFGEDRIKLLVSPEEAANLPASIRTSPDLATLMAKWANCISPEEEARQQAAPAPAKEAPADKAASLSSGPKDQSPPAPSSSSQYQLAVAFGLVAAVVAVSFVLLRQRRRD